MSSTLVYFVRHGQTMENLLGIIQGHLDTKLDDIGIEQATAVARALKDVPFDCGFSSDMTRASDTAEAILRHHAGVELCKTALLRERDMGNLQGTVASFRTQRRPPVDDTVEASSAFAERALLFWDNKILPLVKCTAKTQSERPSCALVVSHAAFINTLARSLVGHRNVVKAPGVTPGWCPNASITLVEVRGDGTGTLLGFGDISHLAMPCVAGNED